MPLALAVIATTALAALAGLAATLATALVTSVPVLFLGAGVAAGVAVWLAGCRPIARRLGPGRYRGLVIAGVVDAVLALAVVLVPLGDPARPPEPPPGAGSMVLPDGGQLAYGVLRGAAGTPPRTPVVVLHGGPGVPDLAGHLAALRPLTADGHDVWAYAQRGSGASSRLADPRGYTAGLAVRDLEHFREHVGAERVILIGHSYGAFLAAAYIAEHRERVERVVFTSPGDLRLGGLGGVPQSRLDTVDTLGLYSLVLAPRAMLAYGLVQVNPAAAHAYAGDRELDARQDRVYARTVPALHCPGRTGPPLHGLGFYASQVPQSARRPAVPDVADQVRGAGVPALVLKGQCDYLSWESATAYLHAFPDSTLSYLPGAGHDAYLDEPQRWVASVRAFVEGRPVPGALADPYRPPDSFQRDP